MKTQNTLLLAAAAVTVLNFQSCSKYEDGPAFSLRSKNSRLVGEWEVVKIDGQTVSRYFEETFASLLGSSYSFDVNANITWEFEDDGDISNEVSGTVEFTYSYYGNNYTYSTPLNSTDSGSWEWKDNKESLDIEWSYAGSTEVEILRLTNNELIIDSDGVEYEFEKN